MTERLHFIFSLSCIGEGNGNPLQCSCLENPRDGGTWWAAIYGVAQSRTQLKRLSSSIVAVKSQELGDFLSPNAGDAGSIPGWGTEIPHDTGQPSPYIATTEAVCSGAQPPQQEKPTHHNLRSLCAAPKNHCSQHFKKLK